VWCVFVAGSEVDRVTKGVWVSRSQKPSRQVAVDEQIQVELAALKGELSLAEAARRHGVSSATVGNWRDRFVDAGKAGMDRSLPGPDGGLSRRSGGSAVSARS
jgi:transposase